MIVTTHHNCRTVAPDQFNLELWHGFPLKTVGLMDKGEPDFKAYRELWDNVGFFSSYSTLYNTIMNACLGMDIYRYRITGMPRNDFLFNSPGSVMLKKLFGDRFENKKTALFMPTFRFNLNNGKLYKEEGSKNWENIFGLPEFDSQKFEEFLERNQLVLFLKLHPFEEEYLLKSLKIHQMNHIILITDRLLKDNGIDLYQLINAMDLLITDYSSVYFDFLLLDRPMIFIASDLEIYKSSRGLLLEPFDFWTPGPKVNTQGKLESEMINCLSNQRYYHQERQIIKRLIHYFDDGNSSDRVWKWIDDILQRNNQEAL
jgi:CDP-glycerol glycerophosphotransferase (TagB/SpsB family)